MSLTLPLAIKGRLEREVDVNAIARASGRDDDEGKVVNLSEIQKKKQHQQQPRRKSNRKRMKKR